MFLKTIFLELFSKIVAKQGFNFSNYVSTVYMKLYTSSFPPHSFF